MILGLSSYTFGWNVGVPIHRPALPLDELGLIDQCLKHGVSLLQIADNLPLHTFDAARLDRLADRAVRDGVQLEVGARGLTFENVHTYTAIARRLGATLIRFVIDDADYHPTPEEVAQLLRQSAPLLTNLRLGIENHDRFPAATLRDMIVSAGSERIGVCLDTANSLGAGEGLDTVLRELAPLTMNLHIKDFSITRVPHLMGFNVEGRPAGDGMLDIPRLLKSLSTSARCETAVLELWTPPEPNLDLTRAKEEAWAAQSLAYLKPLFTRSP